MNEDIKKKLLELLKNKVGIANYFAVSKQTVNHWYNGGKLPSMKDCKKIANFLGVDFFTVRNDL